MKMFMLEEEVYGIYNLLEGEDKIPGEKLQAWASEIERLANISGTDTGLAYRMATEIRHGSGITTTQDFVAGAYDVLPDLSGNDAVKYRRMLSIATSYLSEMED